LRGAFVRKSSQAFNAVFARATRRQEVELNSRHLYQRCPADSALVDAVVVEDDGDTLGPGMGAILLLQRGDEERAVLECTFRTIWAVIPEHLGRESERSDGFISGTERSDGERGCWS
jgi:hypothetical protein